MPRKTKPPRDRTARALCSHFGVPEYVRDKKPMSTNHLDMADAALQAALSPGEWERVKSEGPHE